MTDKAIDRKQVVRQTDTNCVDFGIAEYLVIVSVPTDRSTWAPNPLFIDRVMDLSTSMIRLTSTPFLVAIQLILSIVTGLSTATET